MSEQVSERRAVSNNSPFTGDPQASPVQATGVLTVCHEAISVESSAVSSSLLPFFSPSLSSFSLPCLPPVALTATALLLLGRHSLRRWQERRGTNAPDDTHTGTSEN
jgi:hypothetical protein